MKTEKPKALLKKIYIINRQTGQTDFTIENQVQYGYYWRWFLTQNDIKKALEVFCDLTETTQDEYLKDFNLIDLVNCFSINYIAKRVNNGYKRRPRT